MKGTYIIILVKLKVIKQLMFYVYTKTRSVQLEACSRQNIYWSYVSNRGHLKKYSSGPMGRACNILIKPKNGYYYYIKKKIFLNCTT